MINLIWDSSFIRKFKKLIKQNPELTEISKSKLLLLSKDPFNTSLRTHKLAGKLKDCYSCSIDFNYRVLFKMIESNNFLIIDIGTHDEIY